MFRSHHPRNALSVLLMAACAATNPKTADGSGDASADASVAGTTDVSTEADAGADVAIGEPDAASNDSSSGTPEEDTHTAAPVFPTAPERLGGERPAVINLPEAYTAEKQWPLLLLLHGYSANGFVQDVYLGISKRANVDGVLVLVPDGTVDSEGNQFWNATNACCDKDASGVDDEGYLLGLIAEARKHYNVDPKRIFALGHSNGGFMSYRLACSRSDLFAGVVVLAGAMWKDPGSCPAENPVSVLHVHGTEDETIPYEGTFAYPSARGSAEFWAGVDGCDGPPTPAAATLELDAKVPGAETTVETWSGCDAGTSVELWTLVKGKHLPGFVDESFAKGTLGFLLAHPKP